MSKLIPKHQNSFGPLILKTDNTESDKPVLRIPVNNEIDWVQTEKETSQRAANKARSEQQYSEIITVPEVYNGNDQKEAFIRSFTGNRPTSTTTQVIGLSPVDPVGEFFVGGAVLDAPLKLLGKGIMYGAGRYLPKTKFGNYSRAKLISDNMTVRPYGFGRGYYTIGHDWDPNAFYHYERNILPKTLGGTRLHPRPSNLGEPKIWLSKGKPWLWDDITLYKIPSDKVRTQSSKIIDPDHAEYYITDEIDLLQDGVEILSPLSIPDKGGFLTVNGKKKFYVPTTKTTPETVIFKPKRSNINLFKDNYGREVTPTPFPGTDQEMQDIVLNTHQQVLRDYFSPQKTQQIKKTMGWGDTEISELQDEILRSIGYGSDVKIKGPKEGFVDIGTHQGSVIGTGDDAYGKHIITLNRERMPDTYTVQEAVMHEIGGHGKTMSIDVGEFGKGSYSDMVKEYFPRLTQFTSKNEELANKLLTLNENGQVLSKLKTSDDVEKYIIDNNLPWSKFEELNNKRKYFQYVTSAQEKYARGYTGQLYEKLHGPSTKTLNIKQLEEYYTPESVEKFKKALLGVTPIAVGVGAATNK